MLTQAEHPMLNREIRSKKIKGLFYVSTDISVILQHWSCIWALQDKTYGLEGIDGILPSTSFDKE